MCTAYPSVVAASLAQRLPGAEVVPATERIAGESRVVTRLTLLMVLLALAALSASTLGLLSTMTTAVVERSAELALLRAIGASPAQLAALSLGDRRPAPRFPRYLAQAHARAAHAGPEPGPAAARARLGGDRCAVSARRRAGARAPAPDGPRWRFAPLRDGHDRRSPDPGGGRRSRGGAPGPSLVAAERRAARHAARRATRAPARGSARAAARSAVRRRPWSAHLRRARRRHPRERERRRRSLVDPARRRAGALGRRRSGEPGAGAPRRSCARRGHHRDPGGRRRRARRGAARALFHRGGLARAHAPAHDVRHDRRAARRGTLCLRHAHRPGARAPARDRAPQDPRRVAARRGGSVRRRIARRRTARRRARLVDGRGGLTRDRPRGLPPRARA